VPDQRLTPCLTGIAKMLKKRTRRQFLAEAGGVAAGTIAASSARAANPWPTKPIRVLMPFGAGGSMDLLSRLLAPIVSESLGQPIVVENRPGATGTLTMAAVASAPADGYTLMFTGSSYATIALLMRNLPFKMEDFTPLSRLTVGPSLLAVPSQLGFESVVGFVAAAKAQPGEWSYGSSGIGTAAHLGGELFKLTAGVDLTHIPYRSQPAIIADLLEARIQMSFLSIADCRQYILSGQLRGLALCYGERMPEWPELPTFAEVGYPNVRASNDFGIAIRAGTPAPIQARIEEAYRAAVCKPAIVQRLAEMGLIVVGSSSAEFTRELAADTARYAEVIRIANIKLD
jgi:tripartite-type tricarboxylate transporter receptor subunit TctC